MMVTTFMTSRQMILKTGWSAGPAAAHDPEADAVRHPVLAAAVRLDFPIGVIIYWVTQNGFSFGQQYWVLHKYPPPVTAGNIPMKSTKAGAPTEPKGLLARLRPTPKDGPAAHRRRLPAQGQPRPSAPAVGAQGDRPPARRQAGAPEAGRRGQAGRRHPGGRAAGRRQRRGHGRFHGKREAGGERVEGHRRSHRSGGCRPSARCRPSRPGPRAPTAPTVRSQPTRPPAPTVRAPTRHRAVRSRPVPRSPPVAPPSRRVARRSQRLPRRPRPARGPRLAREALGASRVTRPACVGLCPTRARTGG